MSTMRSIEPKTLPISSEKKEKTMFDSVISILELLPEESQKKVLSFSIALLKEEDSPFRPKTEEELYEKIDRSMRHLKEGKYRNSEEVEKDLIEEFGLHVPESSASVGK